MAFTNFSSSAGHTQLSREIIAELQDLAQRHGLRFSSEGGQLGANDLMIKLRVRAADRTAVEDAAKKAFAMEARYMGLEPEDYGAIFATYQGTYKLVGIKTSRPKYPFLGECQRTGKTFKLPRSIVPQVIAARKPKVQTQPTDQPHGKTVVEDMLDRAGNNAGTDERFADLAQF